VRSFDAPSPRRAKVVVVVVEEGKVEALTETSAIQNFQLKNTSPPVS
jgi:hypothetical protein